MGSFFALLTALIWACAVILLKRSGETVSPFALNLFRVVVSTVLLIPTVLVAGQAAWAQASARDVGILFASGIIAIGISDTLFHASLNMVGAGISSIVDCLYPPLTVVLAMVLLDERLSARQMVGMTLVLGGILAAAQHAPPHGVPPRQIVLGVICGVVAMASLAFGIVIAKPVLNYSPVLWATAVRQVGCLLVMAPIALLSPRRRQLLRVFRPSPAWRFSVPGAVLGSYLALIFWIAGMKYSQVGVAAILNQSSTIYILVLAAIFLGEPFTRRKLVASVLAVAGIVLVTI
ncbi:MAG TPA: DMT family transporter [Thermoanaerobaculaceae bacterium]|nr:DMT family transporter [Thermoanaerobaculaceae bacterium]HPS77052.1 DMT family transporter [Thermoanaerobaculaceae bacterium]